MRKDITIDVATVIVCGSLLLATKPFDVTACEDSRPVVNVSDVPRNVRLIGRLGVPLGEEVVTIRGKWKHQQDLEKDCQLFFFVVKSVNGKRTNRDIELPGIAVRPLTSHGLFVPGSDGNRKWVAKWAADELPPKAFDGDEWEMVGFETGGIVGCPIAILAMHRDVQLVRSRFATKFIFASMRAIVEPKQHADSAPCLEWPERLSEEEPKDFGSRIGSGQF